MLLDLPVDSRELRDVSFSCLPGCGWCCTHPAEVNEAEAARLRALRPNVKVGFDGERSFLRLQGGCGACQFLDAERRCGVYEDRPNHCRWFPFHVYFGRRIEVAVNRSCPGVVDRVGSSVEAEARAALSSAPADLVRRNAEESAETHARFQDLCEEHGAWGDVDAAVAEVLSLGAEVFRADVLSQLTDLTPRHLAAHAGAQFDHGDPTRRPYMVDPKMRWLVLQRRAERVAVGELSAAGRIELTRAVPVPGWEDPAGEVAEALAPHLARLLSRESFAGSVFDRVDEEGYDLDVETAAREEAALVAAELVFRARLVPAVDPQADARGVASAARRFYDSDFLDRPVIGAWL